MEWEKKETKTHEEIIVVFNTKKRVQFAYWNFIFQFTTIYNMTGFYRTLFLKSLARSWLGQGTKKRKDEPWGDEETS